MSAVGEVRRAEVRTESALKRTRWVWLKEALRALLTQPKDREEAEQALKAWYSWARRCRLEPFKRLALTLKAHWQGILNAFDSRLSNGAVEGMNAQIQAAKGLGSGLSHHPEPGHRQLLGLRQAYPLGIPVKWVACST
ncbi:MAG: transposase [Halorhodospira sp.]